MKKTVLFAALAAIFLALGSCEIENLHEAVEEPARESIKIEVLSTSNESIVPSEVCFQVLNEAANSTYAWDFNNDGISDSNIATPCHIFEQPGTFIINLIVTDPSGNSQAVQKDVTIQAQIILPDFQVINDNCTAVCTMEFENTSQNLLGNETFSWTFGNGATSTEKDPNPVTYDMQGSYEVCLIVTSPTAGTIESCKNVTVSSTLTFQRSLDVFPEYSIRAESAIQTQDGGFLLIGTGYAADVYPYPSLMVKLDADYNVLWNQEYNFEIHDIGELSDGRLAVIGENDFDLVLQLLSATGNLLDLYTNEDSFSDSGIVVTENDEILVTYGKSGMLKLLKLSAQNFRPFIEKEHDLGTNNLQAVTDVIIGHNNEGVLIFRDGINFQRFNTNNLNPIGSVIAYEGVEDRGERASTIIKTTDGYAITGSVDYDLGLILTNTSGTQTNLTKFPNDFWTRGANLSPTDDGEFVLAGNFTYIQEITTSMAFVKTTNSGTAEGFYRDCFNYFDRADGPITNAVFVKQVADGGYVVLGNYNGRFWVLKTDADGLIN